MRLMAVAFVAWAAAMAAYAAAASATAAGLNQNDLVALMFWGVPFYMVFFVVGSVPAAIFGGVLHGSIRRGRRSSP